jgi:cyclopropane-fatty-acyl-phospholipid synthase
MSNLKQAALSPAAPNPSSPSNPSSARARPQPTASAAPEPIVRLLDKAGIQINGPHPWDLQVHHPRMYTRAMSQGTLGLGESYMDGDWDCAALDELFARLMRLDVDRLATGLTKFRWLAQVLRHRWLNLQTPARAFEVAKTHYDAGNDIFEAMLDTRMIYSCGYWQHAQDLEQAQTDKLEMICRKLQLTPGMSVLDVGCGWGGLAAFAAEKYGVSVLGITVSKEQLALAQRRVRGLPVTLRLQDYRDVQGHFDRIVSVGMFEHVGPKNYTTYFDHMQRLLAPEGAFLLHTIGSDVTTAATDPWIDRYVFPNGKLPSARELTRALERRFLIEDWHNFGADYDRTLMAWWQRFDAAWPALSTREGAGYDERFYRMWKYYLLMCAGFFRSRQGQLWQLVLTKRERTAVYRSVRM